jgi:NADH:ubiquinone oxidoreductase subunit F (NADH-binding)
VLAVHAGSPSESCGRSLLAENGRLWPAARLLAVPNRYVSSEATAIAAFAAGREARPQDREHSITLGDRFRASVLVLNAETVAQVALLWAGQIGPLTRLVTVSGAVDRPAVLEVDDRVTVAELVARAGGAVEVPRAVLLGGYGGSWLPWALTGTSLGELPALGHGLGAGLVHVLGQRCPVREVGQVLQFLAAESAGQCGPCMFGLPAIADDWDQLADPRTAADARRRLERRLQLVEGRGACRHPDGAVRHAASALQTFDGHLADHAAGFCDAPQPAELAGAR